MMTIKQRDFFPFWLIVWMAILGITAICVVLFAANHTNKRVWQEEVVRQKEQEDISTRRFQALKDKKYNIYIKEQNGYNGNDDFFEVRLCWWDKIGEKGELLSGQDEPLNRFYEKKKVKND